MNNTDAIKEQRSCSLGNAMVIGHWGQVDTDPDVLGAGLPVFASSEWDSMKDEEPARRTHFWARRVVACDMERADRALDPKRTIHSAARPPVQEAWL